MEGIICGTTALGLCAPMSPIVVDVLLFPRSLIPRCGWFSFKRDVSSDTNHILIPIK